MLASARRTLPTALLTCLACAGNVRGAGRSHPPELLLGNFVDDYGGRFTVSDSDWFQRPRSHYHIVAWHVDQQYFVAENAVTNASAAGRWTRIDWMTFPDQGDFKWGFCFSTYDAPSRTAAEATRVVDRANPRKGCNGYPFSRMKRLASDPSR